jgi:hypothetical protein
MNKLDYVGTKDDYGYRDILIPIRAPDINNTIRASSDDPEELLRELDKLLYDYKDSGYFWLHYIADAARVVRAVLATNGVSILPDAKTVAHHGHISEGCVHDVYRSVYAVVAAGGKLPALAEAEQRQAAAAATDRRTRQLEAQRRPVPGFTDPDPQSAYTRPTIGRPTLPRPALPGTRPAATAPAVAATTGHPKLPTQPAPGIVRKRLPT